MPPVPSTPTQRKRFGTRRNNSVLFTSRRRPAFYFRSGERPGSVGQPRAIIIRPFDARRCVYAPTVTDVPFEFQFTSIGAERVFNVRLRIFVSLPTKRKQKRFYFTLRRQRACHSLIIFSDVFRTRTVAPNYDLRYVATTWRKHSRPSRLTKQTSRSTLRETVKKKKKSSIRHFLFLSTLTFDNIA